MILEVVSRVVRIPRECRKLLDKNGSDLGGRSSCRADRI
jgi:hypothetical protein